MPETGSIGTFGANAPRELERGIAGGGSLDAPLHALSRELALGCARDGTVRWADERAARLIQFPQQSVPMLTADAYAHDSSLQPGTVNSQARLRRIAASG